MRIAKFISNAGYCSRREAEKLILQKEVMINGETISSPAINISAKDTISVNGKVLTPSNQPRLWLYHKPREVITTHKDPQGRTKVFDILPKNLPRVISVGRLDYNTEGLLLLTNNGALSRKLELPSTQLIRKYRCRVFGELNDEHIKKLSKGISIDGMKYKPIELSIEHKKTKNYWIKICLQEGKNREIRNILSYFGVEVSRLIRMEYGKFRLGNLETGKIKEVAPDDFSEFLP